jgi:hypothetical protein
MTPSIFCISSYEKGQAFLREAARQGAQVTLLTVDKLRDADWPRDILAEILTMPDSLTPDQLLNTVCYVARTRRIDRIVALDEFDVEGAAMLREHMQLPGLGQTLSRCFRDKFAMRSKARQKGIRVPEFCGVFNHDDLRAFMRDVPGPWLLKPRMNAAAIGIKPIQSEAGLWPVLDELGDLQSHYVLERFLAGEVFHVEGVTWNGKLLCSIPCAYGRPPMQTMHQGGVFTTRTLPPESPDGAALIEIHQQLIERFGLTDGVTHSEFIKSSADGKFYFLETAARVGGAYIADMVEFATGINPWVEWARMEVARASGVEYTLPALKQDFAGAVISLARQDEPDLSAYTDPEIALKLHKAHHAGLLLVSTLEQRTRELVESYSRRFVDDFLAVVAAPDKPTS